ncbi:hypothetical protein ACIQNT_31865 [Streptomyces luteogriseus]|uniref:hypothetical protein n=1 Tax=Streptomyces luteogriseus TaxID=68233 RepID=UPI0037FF2AFE
MTVTQPPCSASTTDARVRASPSQYTDRPFGAQETGASEQQLRDLAGSLGEVAD